MLGTLFGVLTAVAWYLIVWASGSRHPYFMSAIGLTTAYGVYAGSRTVGRRGAITAVTITFVIVLFASYFVERHVVQKWFTDSGDDIRIPLVPYLDWLVEVTRHTFSTSILTSVFGVLALAAAAFFGWVGFAGDEAEHA